MDCTYTCRRAGHDDVAVLENQKQIEFLENHAGWVKHEADIALLSHGIGDHQFHADLGEVLGRGDKLAEQCRPGERLAALTGQPSGLQFCLGVTLGEIQIYADACALTHLQQEMNLSLVVQRLIEYREQLSTDRRRRFHEHNHVFGTG